MSRMRTVRDRVQMRAVCNSHGTVQIVGWAPQVGPIAAFLRTADSNLQIKRLSALSYRTLSCNRR